ncbi:MAG: WD40 repeat domain-containing protein, partial [Chloroflexota bacterium]
MAIDEHQHGVTIRDVATGEVLTRIERDPDRIYQTFAFSPDGRTLLASVRGTYALDIDFYDTETGALLRNFSDPYLYAPALVRYTPDGEYLLVRGIFASGDVGGQNFYILNAESGEIAYSTAGDSMTLPELDIPPVTFVSPLDSFLASSVVLGSPSEPFSLRWVGDAETFALSADGSRYLTYDRWADRWTPEGQSLLLKNAATDALLSEFPYGGVVFDAPHAVVFDPQSDRVAYVDALNRLFVVSPFFKKRVEHGCLFNNRYCLTATDAHSMTMPELETVTNNTGSPFEPDQYVSPDGRWRVMLGSQQDNIVHVTRTEDSEVFLLELGDPLPRVERGETDGHATESRSNPFIIASRVSPDGHWLALAFTSSYHGGYADRVIRVYDVSGDEPVAEPQALLLHDSALITIAFSADNQ